MEVTVIIGSFFTDLILILGEMAPYLLLGFFFAGLLHTFIPKQSIEKYFNGTPVRSSLLAAIAGVPLPLCSCGVIPTGTALYKNGASKGGTVSFLISTPQTGVDSILATFSLMGLPFALIRPVAALVTGISGGLITSVITRGESDHDKHTSSPDGHKSFSQKAFDVVRYGFLVFIQDISKWLVLGLVLAAIISVMIPNDFFGLLNISPMMQMLLILVVSVPMYICATGSIPLAAVLMLKGISPGAAFVLLMAGPATNAATITMIGKVLGKRSLFAYLGTIISGALLFGFLIDTVFPSEWFTQIAGQPLGHSHHESLTPLQLGSGLLLIALIINGYVQKHLHSKQSKNQTIMSTKIIKVEGMTCNHCKASVESNLEKLDFVDKAEVNLANKTVTLEGDAIEVETARAVITSLGYKTQ